jgi:hypothetical protein
MFAEAAYGRIAICYQIRASSILYRVCRSGLDISGGRSVGIVRSRTNAMELLFLLKWMVHIPTTWFQMFNYDVPIIRTNLILVRLNSGLSLKEFKSHLCYEDQSVDAVRSANIVSITKGHS